MTEVGGRQQQEEALLAPSEDEFHEFEDAGRTQFQIAWRKFKRHRMAMVGMFVLIFLYLVALLAPWITPYDPNSGCPRFGERKETCSPLSAEVLADSNQAPSLKHPMGTDNLGRDWLSRVMFGGRVSLAVGLGVALSAGLIGTAMGSLAGFRGGLTDNLLMRVTDIFLAMPVLLVLLIASKWLSGTTRNIVIILAFVTWMPAARIVRGSFLSIKEKEYIEAARAVGVPGFRTIWRHMLPNALGPIIVQVTLTIAAAILAESTLSFLGFGISPPTATWGNMIAVQRTTMVTQPWLSIFPGLMILISVLSVNFMGDGLRDALDPTSLKVRA
ncbi:MAG: ABC transporter permease [Actinobacteria bacterium]|nr:ABC transporter permease [Actinomycetota bacterium]